MAKLSQKSQLKVGQRAQKVEKNLQKIDPFSCRQSLGLISRKVNNFAVEHLSNSHGIFTRNKTGFEITVKNDLEIGFLLL